MLKKIEDKFYNYSKIVAKQLGPRKALILGFLAKSIDGTRVSSGGKFWFRHSASEIASYYPELIAEITVKRALKELCEKDGILLKKKKGRSYAYAFRNEAYMKVCLSKQNALYFKLDHAIKYDIIPAVIIQNMTYWILKNKQIDNNYSWHKMSSYQMSDLMQVERRTFSAAIKSLVADGVLQFKQDKNGCIGSYKFSKESDFLGKNHQEKMIQHQEKMIPIPGKNDPSYIVSRIVNRELVEDSPSLQSGLTFDSVSKELEELKIKFEFHKVREQCLRPIREQEKKVLELKANEKFYSV